MQYLDSQLYLLSTLEKSIAKSISNGSCEY